MLELKWMRSGPKGKARCPLDPTRGGIGQCPLQKDAKSQIGMARVLKVRRRIRLTEGNRIEPVDRASRS
jgi:hypothetical protein